MRNMLQMPEILLRIVKNAKTKGSLIIYPSYSIQAAGTKYLRLDDQTARLVASEKPKGKEWTKDKIDPSRIHSLVT